MEKSQYSIIILILLSLLVVTPTAFADDGDTYKVGTQSLNMRTAPSYDAEVVGQLKFGDQLVAFEEKHGWAQTYYHGKEVWVATHYLTKTESNQIHTQKATHQKDISIHYNLVHLRNGPGTNHKIIGYTSRGDTYSLIKTDGDWSLIQLDDGSTAWVASWLTNQSASQPKEVVSPTPTNTGNPLKGVNIVLDPGHGGIDPGAIASNGEQEKDLTLKVTQAVADNLREAGATVLLTRSHNGYVSLEDRVKISHAYWTDAFISLHYDAYQLNSINGVSTHYANDQDAQLAQIIQTELHKQTGLNDRGIMHSPYYVLRNNNNLSILVELGFLTNPNDLANIQNINHPTNVARAITEGVITYFTNQ